MPSPSPDPLRAYRAYLSWARLAAGPVVMPCHPPGGERCDACPLMSGAGPLVEARVELAGLAAVLTVRKPLMPIPRPTLCATLLETGYHKYAGTGEHACKKCGTAQSHTIHRDSVRWDARRAFYGFGPMAGPLYDASERSRSAAAAAARPTVRSRVIDEAKVHRPKEQ